MSEVNLGQTPAEDVKRNELRWEYEIHEFLPNESVDHVICDLDFMGEDGWELVSVSNLRAYFKRPKQ